MAEPTPPQTPVPAPVTDRRPVPTGTLPRGAQAWLMAGTALGMLAIIFVAGRPEAPSTTSQLPPRATDATNPDRVRDYQDRLRLLDARLAQDAQAPPPTPATPSSVAYGPPVPSAPDAPASESPLVAEQRRRDYESLFASNVVLSRRPEPQRPDSGGESRSPLGSRATAATREPATPSLDDIAAAVVRATSPTSTVDVDRPAPLTSVAQAATSAPAQSTPSPREVERVSPPPPTTGPLHRLPEGTLIEAVLTNRMDGAAAAPVNCLVTVPVYSPNRQYILIPAGARVLGETKPVQGFGDVRLAVAFHRVLLPDGSAVSLDGFIGLNQIGEGGLRDRVNQHYWSTFGAAGAVGLISGLAQYVGTLGFGRGDGDRTLVIAGNAGEATAQATAQVMNRFLNRMPGITIHEGHRVRVYVTHDLDLPAYTDRPQPAAF